MGSLFFLVMPMKNQDTLIVSLLRENSRMSLTKMSRKSRIPISTLYDRMKHFDKSIVRKHTALVDFSQLGFAARARVLLKVKHTEIQNLREHLLCHPAVNELCKVNNGYDFMVELIFKTMKEMEDYLDSLSQKFPVEKEEVVYIIDELRQEEFLSNRQKLLLQGE